MTPDEFRDKMLKIEKGYDTEGDHCDADDLMCKVLKDLGYHEGVAIFERMDKWYA